ncbi:MAG TPA: xanthine dehydrogenase family protein molybdopterin-binding subunit [Anaerolineales bacterium]|nr:xanthine dehydrogenase family protein molybdopterin-binding subunit [Anaerolineales bacterium]
MISRARQSSAASCGAIGGHLRREDALAKVTGRARYVEDQAKGALSIRVLRSKWNHARLLKLDTGRAEHIAGVRRILTANDVPCVNGFPEYSSEEPILTAVGDTLRVRGAPIALVVAANAAQANLAAEAIKVEVEPLPEIFDMEEALRPGAVHIAGEANELSRFTVKQGDTAGSLDASDRLVEAVYTSTFLEHAALERESILGMTDEAGRILVIGGSHQPHNLQHYIAEALGLALEEVRVIVPAMGGSFGGKQDPWPFLAVALAVYHLREPAALIYSRRETFDATPKRHPYRMDFRIGATSGGEMTGLRVHIDCNTGGYDGAGQFLPNYAVTAAGGAYRWKAVDAIARTVYTNGPKAGQFRGFGTSQSTFGLECALDELIEQGNDDPIEFRLRNCIRQEEKCFLGYPVGDSLGYREVLEAVRPDFRAYTEEAEAYNAEHARGPLRRGVGVAGMWYRFGKAGNLQTEVKAELARDGHFIVYCSAPDYGQGISTVMSQIAADAFGVSRHRVEIVNADTARVPNSDIQGASRATFFVGGAVVKGAEALTEALLGVASEMLEAPASQLTVHEDRVALREKPNRCIGLAEVAEEFDRIGKSRRVTGLFDLSAAFPEQTRPEYVPLFITGAHVADVQVDLETGVVDARRIVAAHDVGKAINPQGATGQIEGAVVMGMGAALYEEYLPGQTLDLSHYQLPIANGIPEIKAILVEVPSWFGPHGVKGLGEAPLLPSTPAIINAVSRAIGIRIRSIPATPERILRAIRGPAGLSSTKRHPENS